MDRGRCQSCRAEVCWVVMLSGRRMPLDPQPTSDGNVYQRADGRWCVSSKREPAPEGAPLHTSHFATCSYAAHYRAKPAPRRVHFDAAQSARTVRAEIAAARKAKR